MANRRASKSIALGRTFLEIPDSAEELDPEETVRVAQAFNRGQSWPELLESPYVVVLGEAGTGKSIEFERQADALIAVGQWGFFVEINDLASMGLDNSIDAIDEDRLEVWRKTDNPGVFFLDSLDEAKLQNHTLRQALRRLRQALKSEWNRVRLVISCRASDWMADADRAEIDAVVPKEDVKVKVVQLAPLTDQQVEQLAVFVGVGDIDEFMAAIKNKGG